MASVELKEAERETKENTDNGHSNDFPGRPYLSVRDAIKSKDFEAILSFIKANGFNPNQQTMPQNKRYLINKVSLPISLIYFY